MEELYRSLYAKYATGLGEEDIDTKVEYALEQDPGNFINSFYEKYTGAGPSAEQANYISSKIEADVKDRYDKSEEQMPEDVSMFENTGKWLKGVSQNWFGGWSDVTDNMLGKDVTEDDIMGEDFSKTIEKNTLFEDAIGKNPFSDFMSDIFYRKIISGLDTGGGIDEDSLLHGYDHINDVPEEVMKQYVEHLNRKDIPPPTDEDLVYQQRYDKLKERRGGIQAWFTAVVENPEWLLQTTSQSLAMMGRSVFTKEGLKGISGYGLIDEDVKDVSLRHGGVPGGLIVGKGIDKLADKIPTNAKGKYGTFLKLLKGGLKGAAKLMPIGGAMGGTSYALEKNLTLSETIKEKLAEKELDITPENITKILSNPDDYKKIKNDAVKRGVAIGLVDMITLGFAGGFGRTAMLQFSKTAGLATAATTDVVGGLTSEILGQYAGDQEWRVDEILAEGFAERSKTIALAPYILAQPNGTYSINGEKYNGYKFRRALEGLDDETIALADIKIENDKVLENHLRKRRLDGQIKNSILSTSVTDLNDRQKLFELEKEKIGLEDQQKKNSSQTLTNQIAAVNKKIKDITNQYFEVDPTLKQKQQDQAQIFTGEKDFEKSVAKGKIIMGEDLQVAEDTNEFSNIDILKKNYTQEELKTSAGINHNGKIFINKALALDKNGNINVVAHEILHSALDKHVKTDQGKAAILKFYNNLDKQTKAELDGKLKALKYSNEYLKINPDEYLTQYLDLVEDSKSKVDITDNTITQLNDLLAEFLQSVGLKGKFKTAGDVRRFLVDYRKKFKSGKLQIDGKVKGKKKSTVNLEGREHIPLNEKVDELIEGVKTQDDFLNPKVFDNIYSGIQQGRFDQLFGEGVSQEQKIKMRDELGLRLMNYDPTKSPSLYAWMVGNPQEKKEGHVDYSRKVAKKKLAKESERTKPLVSTIDKEGKTIEIADTTNPFDIDSQLKEIDKTYTNLLEAGVFDGKIIKAIKDKLITEVRIIKKSIYDAVSKNKKVTPFVASIRESIKKQADIIIRKWLGGLANDEFKTNIVKHKKVILENLTTSFLARFAPQTIQKSVDGKKVFNEDGKLIDFKPKWVDHTVWNKRGVKVDKEIATLTGRTSQHQIMRRKPNVAKSITDKEWVGIFFDKNGKIRGMKKESLSQQLAAEVGLDIFKDDLINNGPISEAFNLNNETKEIALEDNYVAEVGRQLERGNVKFSKVFTAPIPEGVDGRTYTKNMNEIRAIVRSR